MSDRIVRRYFDDVAGSQLFSEAEAYVAENTIGYHDRDSGINGDLAKHLRETAVISVVISHTLGLEVTDAVPVATGSLLHDVAKADNPEVFNSPKSMDQYTAEEKKVVDDHPILGEQKARTEIWPNPTDLHFKALGIIAEHHCGFKVEARNKPKKEVIDAHYAALGISQEARDYLEKHKTIATVSDVISSLIHPWGRPYLIEKLRKEYPGYPEDAFEITFEIIEKEIVVPKFGVSLGQIKKAVASQRSLIDQYAYAEHAATAHRYF